MSNSVIPPGFFKHSAVNYTVPLFQGSDPKDPLSIYFGGPLDPPPPPMDFFRGAFSNAFQLRFLSDELVRRVQIRQVFEMTISYLMNVYSISMNLVQIAKSRLDNSFLTLKDMSRMPSHQTVYQKIQAYGVVFSYQNPEEEAVRIVEDWKNEGNLSDAEIRARRFYGDSFIEYIQNPEHELLLFAHEGPSSLPNLFGCAVFRNNLKKLHIQDFTNLKELPRSLGQLNQLTHLVLKNNNLRSLPEELGQLSNLQKLDLEDNKLSSLNQAIGQLSNLRELNLNRNCFASAPTCLEHLKQLQYLYFSKNSLTTLPDWFGTLHQLEILDLEQNNLSSLPQGMGQLSNLRDLLLSNNQFASAPKCLEQLKQLQYLNFSRNLLANLPDWFGALQGLTNLNLDHNKFSSLPPSLRQLKKLKILSLVGNILSSLPDWFAELVHLEVLSFSSNQFSSLPEILCSLVKLQSLNFYDNKLSSLPSSIKQLTELTHLDFSHNRFSAFPEPLLELPKLKALKLQYNQISSLPESFGEKLKQLEKLDIGSNKITALPSSIGLLTQLTCQVSSNFLDYNPYRSLPESLLDLPSELTIQLSGHCLSENVINHFRTLMEERKRVGIPTPRIFVTMPPPLATQRDRRNTQDMLKALSLIADEDYIPMTEFDHEGVALWLKKLLRTSDFKTPRKKEMAQFVYHLFKRITNLGNDFIKATRDFLIVASGSCVDRVTLSIIDLELVLQLKELSLKKESDFKAIFNFLKQLFSTLLIRAIANEKVRKSPLSDEVDIHLGYLLKCKKALNLPFAAEEMVFFDITGIRESEIKKAIEKTQAETQNNLAFLNFLAQTGEPLIDEASNLFYEALKKHLPEKTSAIEAKAEKQQTSLEELCQSGAVNSQDYIQRLDEIKSEKLKAYAKLLDDIKSPPTIYKYTIV